MAFNDALDLAETAICQNRWKQYTAKCKTFQYLSKKLLYRLVKFCYVRMCLKKQTMYIIIYLISLNIIKRFCNLDFQNTLTQTQDRAFRRISELKEQIQLDQLAKKDLEENYRLMLEEKDEHLKVFRTQVRTWTLQWVKRSEHEHLNV